MARSAYLDATAVEPLRLAPGLTLLGADPGPGSRADGQFLARLSDGRVVPLARLPYLVAEAIAEAAMATGALGRGVSAELVAARMNAEPGQEVTAATVSSLVAGQLVPLGLVTIGMPPPAVISAPAAPPAPAAPLAVQGVPEHRPRRRTLALGAAGILAAAGVALTAVALARTGPPPAPPSAAQVQAAAWTAHQLSPGAMVSCDPDMCGLLRQDGIPARQLKTLSAGTRDPLGSSVVIATPAVRSQFGATLATVYAPLVVAAFGAGGDRVEIRAIAPDGASAYRAALAAQHAQLSSAGRELLTNPTIQATPAARAALLAGRVDPRLLAIMSVLSSQQSIRLEAFGDASPGASSLVPLRSVQLGASSAADRSAIRAFLDAQRGTYHPARVAETRDTIGQPVVTVTFGAPDPLSMP